MGDSREPELLGRIQLLEQRIEELELKNLSNNVGLNGASIHVQSKLMSKPRNLFYFFNFIGAAIFPMIAGAVRVVYKKIYGLK
jgi:hypothetical protein